MKKKIIVACGGAVATSTIAANKVVELCKENGIFVKLEFQKFLLIYQQI